MRASRIACVFVSLLVAYGLAAAQDPVSGFPCDSDRQGQPAQDEPSATPTVPATPAPSGVIRPIDPRTFEPLRWNQEGGEPYMVPTPEPEEGNTDLDVLIALYPGSGDELSDEALADLRARIAALEAEIKGLQAAKRPHEATRAEGDSKRRAYDAAAAKLRAFDQARGRRAGPDPERDAALREYNGPMQSWFSFYHAWDLAVQAIAALDGQIAAKTAEIVHLQAELARREAENQKRREARERHGRSHSR